MESESESSELIMNQSCMYVTYSMLTNFKGKHNKLSDLFANLVFFQECDEFGQHGSVALYQEVGRVAVSLDAVNN